MGNIVNKLCSSESGNTDEEHTDTKERVELSDTPGRDEVAEENDNERPRNDNNAEEGDIEDMRMQLCTSNYVIMREIMSHLDWREQLPCELVCRLWRDAVTSVQRTTRSYDFAMDREVEYFHKVKLYVSDMPVQTRPMCAIGFYINDILRKLRFPCEQFSPVPCDPPCATKHTIIQAVHEIILSKRAELLAVGGEKLIYKPLPSSHTYQYAIHNMDQDHVPSLVGLYLPKMPNVNYRTVHYRSEDTAQEDFYSIVDDICTTDIIKGVVMFAQTEDYLKFENGNLGFLNYIKNKQPSIPYALGGTLLFEEDVRVRATVAVFSVPKEPEPGPSCQFNMYSLIIDSTVRGEAAIQKVIKSFAGNIPELQHSAALMMSHLKIYYGIGIYSGIDIQELFRTSFPRTTLVGCYNYIIIGYNHPDTRPQPTEGIKRPRLSDLQPDFMHRDSTVFVYFSWGKQRTSGEEAHHS